MKPETIASDIRTTLAARDAEQARTQSRNQVLAALDNPATDPHAPLEHAVAARNASLAAQADLKRIPAARRTLVAGIVTAAERIADLASRACGGYYSGCTHHTTRWGTRAEAYTTTTAGDQYSRGCTYRKTNACHWITLDPAGVALLVECEALRRASAADGLHLIALYPDQSAVWVKSHGKTIVSERGWIVGNASCCYHSTKSFEHATKGYARKLAAQQREAREIRKNRKQERRARLITRLCSGITATIEDARALGFCTPGIQAFQSRYGIGDTATLPELIHTGDPSAVRLALSLARKIVATTP